VRGRARAREIGAGAGERQLERAAPRVGGAFFRGTLAAERLDALGFSLLEFDVLTLKPSSHRVEIVC
jgi:hypothetical protein